MTRILRAAVCGAAFLLSGCAGTLTHYIVDTRNHQGDLAYQAHNFADAATAYRLALRLAPQDEHARAGLAAVQLHIAAELFQKSDFDGALTALAVAAKYDPQSVRLAELKSDIGQARIKREIVVSNYPTYAETGRSLRRAYLQLKAETATIVAALQRFDYTYDSEQLVSAIKASFALRDEVGKLTNRLVTYRQLVESGSPERAAPEPLAPAASLLPLP
jgi:tetratricopeptide (TPR) repeat protein